MCLHKTYWEEWEKANLAPYASKSSDKELDKRLLEIKDKEGVIDPAGQESRYRTSFQIDKDRIQNSTAFRRLEYKTQMFVNHQGDNYRTRLTHTAEVASIARHIAEALRLNEDLVEAIALGHDLGHTPFGHAGEDALDKVGLGVKFCHNIQGLRQVDELEEGYDWDRRNPKDDRGKGLNLTWAVREGILKHTSRGFVKGDKHSEDTKEKLKKLGAGKPATLEGQVVALADEIAQRVNDLEDGLRSELITKEEVGEIIKNSIGNRIDLKSNCNKEYEKIKEKKLTIKESGDFVWLIRADIWPKQDSRIVTRRRGKYLHIYKQCQKGKPPSIGNLIGFVRGLWTSNVIEYSRKKIKDITEVNETKFYKGKRNNTPSPKVRDMRRCDRLITKIKNGEDIDILNCIPDKEKIKKLEQQKLKNYRNMAPGEFCEIEISFPKKNKGMRKNHQNSVANVKTLNKVLHRKSENEALEEVDPNNEKDSEKRKKLKERLKKLKKGMNQEIQIKDTTDYFVYWINSDMAVWRTQRVLVFAKNSNGKFIYRNYPIEQVKIKIEKEVISFSDKMKDIDEEFKNFIQRRIHRSPMVSRMNNKGSEMVTQIYDRFMQDPFQLHKKEWDKYPKGDGIPDIKTLKELDSFAESFLTEKSKTIQLPKRKKPINLWNANKRKKDRVFKDELKFFIDNFVKNDSEFKQLVADHISSMTDRFLINEYERLFLPSQYVEEKREKSFSE